MFNSLNFYLGRSIIFATKFTSNFSLISMLSRLDVFNTKASFTAILNVKSLCFSTVLSIGYAILD